MHYNYEGVTEIRFLRERQRLELKVGGKDVVIEGVKRLYLKSVPFIDADGTIHLNKGRVSLSGDEAAAGD